MTPSQTAAIPKNRTRIFSVVLRAGSITTPGISAATGLPDTTARYHLRKLKADGIVTSKVQKGGAVGEHFSVWSISDQAMGKAMQAHAQKPKNQGGMGQRPKLPEISTTNQQAGAGKISARKASIVAFIEKYPGTTRSAIISSIKGCTDNDFANLRMAGRIHARWDCGMWCYHPGPKPEVTR